MLKTNVLVMFLVLFLFSVPYLPVLFGGSRGTLRIYSKFPYIVFKVVTWSRLLFTCVEQNKRKYILWYKYKIIWKYTISVPILTYTAPMDIKIWTNHGESITDTSRLYVLLTQFRHVVGIVISHVPQPCYRKSKFSMRDAIHSNM